nr:protein of unknown function (DUF448) [uncultured bacterium]
MMMNVEPGPKAASETNRPRRQKGQRPKHVPQRTCVACRTSDAKRSYVRLVRTADGLVNVDPTGKQNGRGAYLCRTRACWQRGLDNRALDRALKIEIDDERRAELREYARSHFPPDAPTDTSNTSNESHGQTR